MADDVKMKASDDMGEEEWDEPKKKGQGKGWFGDSRRHAICGAMGGRARKKKRIDA